MIDQVKNLDVYIEEIANAEDEQTRHEVAARARGYLGAILDFMDNAEHTKSSQGRHIVGLDVADLNKGPGGGPEGPDSQ